MTGYSGGRISVRDILRECLSNGSFANGMKNRRRQIIFRIIVGLILLIGLLVLLYPTISNFWNERRNAQLINQYEASASAYTDDTREQAFREAQEYNAQHNINTIADVFDENDEYILTHPYDTLLNPSGNGVMGYIEIPEIRQRLAIYHGTGTYALENGVGHVEGTSLPIGCPTYDEKTGKISDTTAGTHSVLAGHRGLPSAKLFSDLDKMEKGDLFYLNVLNLKMAYKVDQILVVEPDQVEVLAIEKGKDLVTLLTCTPYGVNSHRLLIRGYRIPFVEDTNQMPIEIIDEQAGPVLPMLLAGLSGVAVIWFIIAGKRKRGRENAYE